MSVSDFSAADSAHLLQTMPWGVLVLNADGTVALLNPTAEALWGLPAAAVLGKQPGSVRQALPPAATNPAASGHDCWLPHTQQWIAVRAAPAPDGRVWIYWDNVTARRQAQEEAQQGHRAERRSSHIIESLEEVAGMGYYEAELATMRFHFSDGMFRLFGEVPQSFEPTLEFINSRSHPEDVPVVRQALDQAILTLKPYRYQRRILRSGGEIRTVEAHGAVIHSPDGTPTMLRGLVQDITERVQTHAETLRLTAELGQRATDIYHTLFNFIDEGFFVLDMQLDATGQVVDGRILEANQVFERQTELVNAVGKTLVEVIPAMGPTLLARYGHLVLTGEAVRFEIFIDELSHRWFSVYASRVGGAGSRQIAVVFDDITARKHHEEGLRQRIQRKAFLLRLGDTLRPLSDPAEIQSAACRIIGEHFQTNRTYYIELDFDEQLIIIKHEYVADQAQSVVGIHPAQLYAGMMEEVKQGRLAIVEDVEASPLIAAAEHPAYEALAIRAFACVPLMKEGMLVGGLMVTSATPRRWTEQEIELQQEVAERTWAAVVRARAEEALRDSETRLRTLIDNLPGGAAFIVDRRLRYQLAAGEALHNMGSTAADFVGRSLAEVIAPEELETYEASYRQALAGLPFEREHEIGGRAFVSKGVPLLTTTGEVSAVLVVSYDITHRKQAEQALRQSEERLRIALEAAELGTWSWDLTTNAMYWNERHFTLFGLPPSPNPRTPADFARHVHAADRAIVMQRLRTTIAKQEIFRAEFRIVTAQGEIRWMSGYSQITDTAPDGQPQHMSGVVLDISERKQTEQQLQEMAVSLERKVERRTQALQQSRDLLLQAEAIAELGSWEYNLTSGAFQWSAGMYRLFARPVGSPVVPALYLEYAVAEDRAVAERLVRCVTRKPQNFDDTLRLRVGEQVKTVRIRAMVQHDANGQPQRVLGVDLDLSEMRRLEADNLRLRLYQQQRLFEAVQQAQETERKRIAEALHNGVGQLLFATKLRLDQLHAPGLSGPALLTTRNESERLLAEAIQQTRALSHELVPMVLEEFGLSAALHDICHKLHGSGLHFHCSVQLDEQAPVPPSLQLALYRMAQEMTQNVVKHAHGATEVSLELESMPGFVVLRVEDNGPGFANGQATNVGLGLRSIRDRVALLGGTLDMGTASPSGVYVRLRIPLPPVSVP